MPLDKEFLDILDQYIPSEEKAQKISYEEARLTNTKDMIKLFEDKLLECDQENTLLREYYMKQIKEYKEELNSPPVKYTDEDMFKLLDELKESKEFNLLPLPIKYLEKLAKTDDDKKDELNRINFMKLQVNENNEAKRLENYKNYLLEKIDRKKLDKKFKK
jgi:hypothetical protein